MEKNKKPSDESALTSERKPVKTNGDKHNLIPDEASWAEEAKEDLEEFIESQGIHIRQ